MNVLVLGAYGLIGREIAAELVRQGHQVTGLGRNAATGASLLPGLQWIGADLSDLTTPRSWQPHLRDIEAVVNAAGVLQSSPRDPQVAIQEEAMAALLAAAGASTVTKLVQISAPGADPSAATDFLASKGRADAAIRKSALDWVILRPGMVIAAGAYGGSALVRALAAVPLVAPVAMASSRVQTVSAAEVARAVARALTDGGLNRQTFDLVEPAPHALLEIVLAVRRWLGFPAPRAVIEPPHAVARAVSKLADAAGVLGWRPPLRSAALAVLANGVTGDPEPWRRATGETLSSLQETLSRLPSTVQERRYARTELVFPVLVVLFSLFWIASGLIALARVGPAAALIAPSAGESAARFFVIGGAVLDIAIGAGLLMRRWFLAALAAAVLTSLAYLAAGTWLRPDLWLDPLGPLVKILPVIALAMALASYAEER